VITKQQIKYIRSLHQKKFRDEFNCFIAEGYKIINEVIATQSFAIEIVVCTPGAKAQLNLSLLNSNVKLIEVSSREFSRISVQKTPQEAMAVLKMNKFSNSLLNIDGSIVFALDRIQNPGNFGTILRLADWFGVNDILCSDDCVDVYNQKVIQASMGAFLRINLFYGKLSEMLIKLKEQQGFSLFGTFLNGNNIYEEKFNKKSVIILGNESSGISEQIKSLTDRQIRIPNYSAGDEKTESLNVSVAAAIICSEIRRREYSATQNGITE
jgi:TrmH family RNA methyltransferase